MASETGSEPPNKIFGYEKQILTGRNPIENIAETLKGVLFGPLIWIKGIFILCLILKSTNSYLCTLPQFTVKIGRSAIFQLKSTR